MREVAARIRRLFRADPTTAELVAVGNGYASIGVSLIALVRWELSLGATLAVAAGSFLLLGIGLLYRATIWIAALLGSAAAALGPTLLLAAAGLRLGRPAGLLGALVGLTLGLSFAFRSYIRLGKLARAEARKE